MKVTTTTGATFEVNDNAFRDYRTVRAYSAVLNTKRADEERLNCACELVRCVMRDDEEAFISSFEENGYIDTEKVLAETLRIMEILRGASEETKKP